MTGLVDEAIRTLREEAPISLLRKVLRLVRTKKVRAIDDRYWDWQGGVQELTIGSASARFDAHSAAGGDAIRWLYLNEREMVRQLVTKLNPKDVFFDVGANVGFFSCFAANQIFDGHVIAFEPFPPNLEQLRRNLRRNDHENVDIKPVALSDSTGKTQLTAPDDGEVGGQTPSLVSENGKFTVEQYTADDLIREGLPIPSVVKINVEGAEPKVIRGMYE
jgi:FkbM family methyltransferase